MGDCFSKEDGGDSPSQPPKEVAAENAKGDASVKNKPSDEKKNDKGGTSDVQVKPPEVMNMDSKLGGGQESKSETQQRLAGTQQSQPGAQQIPAVPQQSPAKPQQSPAGPQQSPAGPQQSPAGPQQSPAGVQQSPEGPPQSPAGPPQNQAKPQQSPAGPQQGPAGPPQSSAGPPQSPAKPQQSSAGPQQSPAKPQQSPTTPQQSPAGPQQSPSKPQQSPAGAQQSPAGAQQSPAGAQQSPAVAQQSPAVAQQSPAVAQKSPEVAQQSPTVAQQSPTVAQLSPAGAQQIQAGAQQIQVGTQESQVGTQQTEDVNKKPTAHFRRLTSAGLEVDSVLRRKTGNVKDHYTLGEELGHGQFGTIFLCVEKASGKEFACKSILKKKLVTEDDMYDVRKEIEIMHHLKGNSNVITIQEAYEDDVSVHVVMELCAGGELFDRIVDRGYYSEKDAAGLARTILGVVQTCHSLGVVHRDLKPENFLFLNEEEESPLKAIDFGLSCFFKPGDILSEVVGSPYYIAPEVLNNCYGPECDVWSAGVVLYILLTGVQPFWAETDEELFEQVLHAEIDYVSEPWPEISEDALDLVRGMLVRDPKERLKVHEVMSHPWMVADGVAPDKPLDHSVLSRLRHFSVMNRLKQIALRVISEKMTDEEIAGMKQMFKTIDLDCNGKITFEELKEGLISFGANIDGSEIQRLMKSADVDNSGSIDYGEFLAAMVQLYKTDKEDYLLEAFTYFDKDGSGHITKDELQLACREFGVEEVRLEDIMSDVDQDKDGRIDYKEFVSMMQKGFDMDKKGVRKP